MTENLNYIAIIAVVAIVTAIIRGIPFILFSKGEVPKSIQYLGDTLPSSIMIILVIFCVKDVSFTSFPFGLPEIVSTISIVILQYKKGNTLLSILLGTAIYMLLIRII